MEEDEDILIILGHLFMNTRDMVIEVRQGNLTLRMGKEQVVFKLSDIVKKHAFSSTCNFIQARDPLMLWWKPHSQV